MLVFTGSLGPRLRVPWYPGTRLVPGTRGYVYLVPKYHHEFAYDPMSNKEREDSEAGFCLLPCFTILGSTYRYTYELE